MSADTRWEDPVRRVGSPALTSTSRCCFDRLNPDGELKAIVLSRDALSFSDLIGRVGYFDGPDSHALSD